MFSIQVLKVSFLSNKYVIDSQNSFIKNLVPLSSEHITKNLFPQKENSCLTKEEGTMKEH